VWLGLAAAIFVASAAAPESFEIVHSFPSLGLPQSKLTVASDGHLWGTTRFDGPGGQGSVFRIDAAGNFASIHSFGSIGGSIPDRRGLVQASDGAFYFTTYQGGAGS
jgi:uncharacterized repeat protein (TIGR03803 family)